MSKTRRNKKETDSGKFPKWAKWLSIAAVLVVILASGSLAVGAQLENNDQFCASCHTAPETTFVDRSTQPAADLASAHAAEGVGCIACHSGEGFAGRLDAMKLGARDLVAFAGRNFPQPSQLTHAIPDGNCLKCHGDIAKAQTFDNHFHVLLERWQQARPTQAATCVDCHTSHDTTGRQDLKWVVVDSTQQQCNGCHRIMGD